MLSAALDFQWDQADHRGQRQDELAINQDEKQQGHPATLPQPLKEGGQPWSERCYKTAKQWSKSSNPFGLPAQPRAVCLMAVAFMRPAAFVAACRLPTLCSVLAVVAQLALHNVRLPSRGHGFWHAFEPGCTKPYRVNRAQGTIQKFPVKSS